MEYLFTYGTLRPSLYPANVERFKLTPIKDGFVYGFSMISLGAFPAIISDGALGKIIGEVVGVENLERIDHYEGYSVDGEGLYDRRVVNVEVAGPAGHMLKTWIYFMKAKPEGTRFTEVPSGDWLDVIRPRC